MFTVLYFKPQSCEISIFRSKVHSFTLVSSPAYDRATCLSVCLLTDDRSVSQLTTGHTCTWSQYEVWRSSIRLWAAQGSFVADCCLWPKYLHVPCHGSYRWGEHAAGISYHVLMWCGACGRHITTGTVVRCFTVLLVHCYHGSAYLRVGSSWGEVLRAMARPHDRS